MRFDLAAIPKKIAILCPILYPKILIWYITNKNHIKYFHCLRIIEFILEKTLVLIYFLKKPILGFIWSFKSDCQPIFPKMQVICKAPVFFYP